MNPAILRLLRFHLAARIRRIRTAFSTPRRMMLTMGAVLLGIVWLGQTIASVIFRNPYHPESFQRWTSLLLMMYFGWHFIRVAYKRPDEAIEWSTAEAEQIVGGPFSRRDILIYRFLVILTSTFPKALLTAFVLLPDLWWSGLPGIVLALVFLECFRLAIDIAVCCLPDRAYLIARTFVFGAMLIGTSALFLSSRFLTQGMPADPSGQIYWVNDAVRSATALRDSVPVAIVEQPFVVFADVISAQEMSASLAVSSILSVLMVAGILLSVIWLDRLHQSLVIRRERILPGEPSRAATVDGEAAAVSPLPSIPRLGTIGPVVWRQMKSAGRYWGSLLVALAIPAVLSCMTLFSMRDATMSFLALVAAVVFYSFVLLPEAIKFDFRLDCDHLTQLKMLPAAPSRIVIGQLAVPILIATVFQVALFLFAGAVRPVSPMLVGAAIILTIPVNALFVSLDNLIFLLYPHRPTQEGFEAFVRTILKFTFKSVLLGVAGVVLLFWALASRYLVDAGGVPELVQPVFVAGITVVAWLSAIAAIAVVSRAFDRFDVSVSVPA